MSIIYVLSIVYLAVSFLIHKKNNEKKSIVSSIIYAVCLLFCYNTLIVYICSFFNIGGSLFNYSLVNCIVGTILNLISFKCRERQEYFFDKKEFISSFVIVLVVLLISFCRFRCFTTLSYETGDPAVHYKHALTFKENLEILNKENSENFVYGNFSGVMPISYVNCGLMMMVMDNIPTYRVFVFFDVFSLMASSLLFFITIINVFKKKEYLYSLGLSLIYLLGFPLNNMLFGFCYLGLGVMVINLLVLTMLSLINYHKYIFMNLIILFMLSFSVFFSYYLFMPFVYLTLGIYYIYLFKSKKLTLKELFIYEVITLVIPFVLGLIKFVLPGFIEIDGTNVITIMGCDGYIYDNDSAGYFFVLMSIVFLIRSILKRKELKQFDYWMGCILGYVLLFYILRMINVISPYYFYKLFYLYWFFAIIFVGKLLIKKRYCLYTLLVSVLIIMGVVLIFPNNSFSEYLIESNVFSWNARNFLDDKITFTKDELEIVNESIKYESDCVENGEFLISGHRFKNVWYYSMTDNIPLYGYQYDKSSGLGSYNITFDFWRDLENYKCLIYFYEDDKKNINESKLDILFSNEEGAILMKK